MSVGKNSQCYFVQLQIDSYLDGDLDASQRATFMAHLNECAGCASELQYARSLQDQLMDLPRLDCPEHCLEPVRRLLGRDPESADRRSGLMAWLGQAPSGLRYGLAMVPLVLALLLLLPLLGGGQDPIPQTALQTPVAPGYSQEEVAEALRDLNLAIDYLNRVSERTEVMIGERFVVAPLRETLDASFEQIRSNSSDHGLDGGPI